ncbi:ThiF family adenylyltransferase [Microbacterium sp. NPDC057650]|uniref:ThiF family adenylyltransferase n=1 Tax=unclassified Microbacterium TaxID=2609290 RepID=UPI00366E7F41
MSLPALVEPGPPLSQVRAARFARHVTLPGVGGEGQRRIAASRVLVIGAGGLGAPIIQYLVAAGVGRITVIDDDRVERSNLQRQVLHGEADLGRAKAVSAQDAAALLDPCIEVTGTVGRLDPGNALELFSAHDLVLDGSDNFATRYLVNDAAELTGTPVVWGGIHRFSGQLSVFLPGHGPMLRDLFPDVPEADAIESCAVGGVFGALCGVVGSAMAVEALKLICGIGEPLIGRLARYDALGARWDELRFSADPGRPPVLSLAEVAVLCGAPTGRSDDISADEVVARLGGPGLTVIDVRTHEERGASAIPGSAHLPLADILDRGWPAVAGVLDAVGGDIVLVCQAGLRSARAIDALAGSAPEDAALRNLAGGMNAWEAASRTR